MTGNQSVEQLRDLRKSLERLLPMYKRKVNFSVGWAPFEALLPVICTDMKTHTVTFQTTVKRTRSPTPLPLNGVGSTAHFTFITRGYMASDQYTKGLLSFVFQQH